VCWILGVVWQEFHEFNMNKGMWGGLKRDKCYARNFLHFKILKMDPFDCTKCPSNEVNARLRGLPYRRLLIKRLTADNSIHVFPSCTVRFGKDWVAFGIRVDVHFLVALPRTQHTSRLYVYSWILPLSECSNCRHTSGWPYTTKQKAHLKITARCHRNLKFRKTLFTVH